MFHLTGRDDFATYAHGSKRIDYILCDAWVSDTSIQGCYEPFQYCLKGDHPMVVDFDTNLLFGNPTVVEYTPDRAVEATIFLYDLFEINSS